MQGPLVWGSGFEPQNPGEGLVFRFSSVRLMQEKDSEKDSEKESGQDARITPGCLAIFSFGVVITAVV